MTETLLQTRDSFSKALNYITMKNIALAFVTAFFIFSSCQKPSSKDPHTSRNSLDWQGVYYGILPCADCEGILTTVQLNSDNTYVMSQKYLGKNGDIIKVNGSITWHESGNLVTLIGSNASTPPSYCKLGENKMTQLDLEGNLITGALAAQYALTKAREGFANKYWRLVMVSNKKIVINENQRKEPHIIFHHDLSVTGTGGCNNFRGTYQLTENNGITFSPLMATKMACMETTDVEALLFEALSETSSYTVEGDSLRLYNREKSKLATFGVVWLR
jgi:copper homeostasis protein (lipoprotein)